MLSKPHWQKALLKAAVPESKMHTDDSVSSLKAQSEAEVVEKRRDAVGTNAT